MEDTKTTNNIVREMQKTAVVYTQQKIHQILTGLLRHHHRLMKSVPTCINYLVM